MAEEYAAISSAAITRCDEAMILGQNGSSPAFSMARRRQSVLKFARIDGADTKDDHTQAVTSLAGKIATMVK